MKFEPKKQLKDEYTVKINPTKVTIPAHYYLAISGKGDPNGEDFSINIGALYPHAYAIKMGYKKSDYANQRKFDDYVVAPLEGTWSISDEAIKKGGWTKKDFVYQLRIAIPDFVPREFAQKIYQKTLVKKADIQRISEVKLIEIPAYECITALHVGSYDDEPLTFEKMTEFARELNLERKDKKHIEVYLSDARKVAPDRRKTILRFLVERPFELETNPFYSSKNQEVLRKSMKQMEETGGTVHEVFE
jgi:hypothetical protein